MMNVRKRLWAQFADSQAQGLDFLGNPDLSSNGFTVIVSYGEAIHGLQNLPANKQNQALKVVCLVPWSNSVLVKEIQIARNSFGRFAIYKMFGKALIFGRFCKNL